MLHDFMHIFRKYDIGPRLPTLQQAKAYLQTPTQQEIQAPQLSTAPSLSCNVVLQLHYTKCIYGLECKEFSATYIGSTVRLPHIRIREHHNSRRCSDYSHKASCGDDYNVCVLLVGIGESDWTNLRIRETLRPIPNNSRQERDEFTGVLF